MNKNDIVVEELCNMGIPLKNQVDKDFAEKTAKEFVSKMYSKHSFLSQLSYEAQSMFINLGYLPQNTMDANNFLNGIAEIGDKKSYNIDYALAKILPKEKYFPLDSKNFIYALYPKIWKNLTVEDRLVALNFSYKKILKDKNLDSSYRLTWIDEEKGSQDMGFTNPIDKVVFLGLDNAISEDSYAGLTAYALLAHEVNHISQQRLASKILKLKDKSNLNSYEKALNSNNALLFLFEDYKMYLDKKHQNDYLSVRCTAQWQEFIDNLYYYDLTEISSGNIQTKYLLNYAKDIYSRFGKDATKDRNFLSLLRSQKNLYNKEDGENYFDNLEEISLLKTLCGYCQNALAKTEDAFDLTNKIPNATKILVQDSLNNQIAKLAKLQGYILETVLDTFNNGIKVPETFDRKLFDQINNLMEYENITPKDVLEQHKSKVEKLLKEDNVCEHNM